MKNILESLFFRIDLFWCSNTQLPAALLIDLSEDTSSARQVSRLRSYAAIGVFFEFIGYFLITMGFYPTNTTWFLVTGITIKVIGAIIGSRSQNQSGTIWCLELQHYLKCLKTHAQEIQAILTNKGCSEAEINALKNLPSDVYQTEINSYQRARLLNLGTPIACGLAIYLNGDILMASLIILLGLLSFPIGEYFFKEYTFRSESQLRIGRSAQMTKYLQEVYHDHVNLTSKINFLSQIPLIIFSFRFIWSGGSQLLASFFGLTQGLAGLSGTLAFQRLRASTLRTTDVGRHLISALTSHLFIISPRRWNEHTSQSQAKPSLSIQESCSEGVVLLDFSTCMDSGPNGEMKLSSSPLSLVIPNQGIAVLQAPSGFGKSTFLLALLHLIEHAGEIYFVSDSEWLNVHNMTQKEFGNRIFFSREDGLEKSARLTDIFKDVLQIRLNDLKKKMEMLFGITLSELAWMASDNLIEQEIKHLKAYGRSIFPPEMGDMLCRMRGERKNVLSGILSEGEGNLVNSRIYPDRIFSTLSSGEKRRILCLLAYEMAKNLSSIRLVVLEEPLTHLDTHNLEFQIKTLQKMQALPTPPAVLIISHHFISNILDNLVNVQIVPFSMRESVS